MFTWDKLKTEADQLPILFRRGFPIGASEDRCRADAKLEMQALSTSTRFMRQANRSRNPPIQHESAHIQ